MANPNLRAVPDPAVPHYDTDIAAKALEWLDGADTTHLACRGNHNFPKLALRGGKLPKGIRADRLRAGGYQLTETCPDCGTRRIYTTVPGGYLPDVIHYQYDWPDGYRMPKGASRYVSSYDCRAKVWDRIETELDTFDLPVIDADANGKPEPARKPARRKAKAS